MDTLSSLSLAMMIFSSINNYAPSENYGLFTFGTIESTDQYTDPVEYDTYKQKIEEIRCLPDNWDGYNASKIGVGTYNNTSLFIEKMDIDMLDMLSENDITPTPYGTITLNFRNKGNLVSVEIGENNIGFFTEFKGTEDIEIDSERFIADYLPEKLKKAFKILENA